MMGSSRVKYFILVIPRCSINLRTLRKRRYNLQLISVSHRYDYIYLCIYRDSQFRFNLAVFKNSQLVLHTIITNSPPGIVSPL